MSDQNGSNHSRQSIPQIPMPQYNQVSNVFSQLGQNNQPFPLSSQQFPSMGRQPPNSRVPPRPQLNRQRLNPNAPQWPLRTSFPFVGQPNQLLMQPSFQFSPDVMNNSPQLMLLNQQRNNLAALYFQQMAQAQNTAIAAAAAAAANQNASPIVRPLSSYPSASNLSSTSSNSPVNKDSSLTKQNSHSSLVNSPDSNTNTSSVTTSIPPTTSTTNTTTTASTTTLAASTTTTTTANTTANATPPLAAAVPAAPITPQNLLAAAVASTAAAAAVKPPNPVEVALAASNAVAANNIASPVFQQKLIPITQHKRKTLPIANTPPIVTPQINTAATFLQQRSGLINPANPLLRPVVDPHLLVPTTTSHIPPQEFDNGIDDTVLLTKRRIQELVSRIDPNERLDNDVEELIMEITQQFVKEVTEFSCKLAKHRKSDLLEAKDLVLGLNMKHNIQVPGFVDSIKPINKKITTQRHQQKVLMIRKAIRDKSLGIRKTVSFKDHSEGKKYNKHKESKNNNNNNNNDNNNNNNNNTNNTNNNDSSANNENKKPNNEKTENANIKTEN
ncbi:hypothetical protein BCR32DRAFT_237117 [Anaeromyces robustus]|uniref:Transcription initiation factor TFIID subunit 12 domain-containing protein n=1 Tax=Anaeromyces robustus TaxID=1754192 RepID=A0A1Y1WQE8_9FUNG|nr:hypothetical protein BCR32DRAFT_237117 [Anaeromyces robustus]|eukprot:ORX75761.1 hypothetical protein BCR32DRAFT_237117 [Anaeromyces robustus]